MITLLLKLRKLGIPVDVERSTFILDGTNKKLQVPIIRYPSKNIFLDNNLKFYPMYIVKIPYMQCIELKNEYEREYHDKYLGDKKKNTIIFIDTYSFHYDWSRKKIKDDGSETYISVKHIPIERIKNINEYKKRYYDLSGYDYNDYFYGSDEENTLVNILYKDYLFYIRNNKKYAKLRNKLTFRYEEYNPYQGIDF